MNIDLNPSHLFLVDMTSTTYSQTLLHHLDDLRHSFATATSDTKREQYIALMKEAHKIYKIVEKLSVAETLQNLKKQKTLKESIDFSLALLVLHINQTTQ